MVRRRLVRWFARRVQHCPESGQAVCPVSAGSRTAEWLTEPSREGRYLVRHAASRRVVAASRPVVRGGFHREQAQRPECPSAVAGKKGPGLQRVGPAARALGEGQQGRGPGRAWGGGAGEGGGG